MASSYTVGDAITTAIFLAGSYSGPAGLWLALYTSIPNPDNSGTEAAFTNYARQSLVFGALASHQVKNSATITFPTSGSTGSSITYVAIMNSASGTAASNLVCYVALSAALPIGVGTIIQAAVNAITASTV